MIQITFERRSRKYQTVNGNLEEEEAFEWLPFREKLLHPLLPLLFIRNVHLYFFISQYISHVIMIIVMIITIFHSLLNATFSIASYVSTRFIEWNEWKQMEAVERFLPILWPSL